MEIFLIVISGLLTIAIALLTLFVERTAYKRSRDE